MRRPVFVSLVASAILFPVAAALVVHSLLTRSTASPVATGPPAGPYRGSEPPAEIHVPQFSLKSYRGHVVAIRSLRGRVVLVTFLDTNCTTKCPIIASEIADALRLLSPPQQRQVTALALTVEPRRDTPASVRRFLRRRHALGALEFLLGTERQMRPVWRAFHILAAAETGNSDVHSADVRVFDRRGIWVSTLHVGVDLTAPNLAHDIRVALGDRAARDD